MSIYFLHLFLQSFLISFFAAYLCKKIDVYKILLSVFVGFIFGYMSFYIFNYEKLNSIALILADCVLLVGILLLFLSKFNAFAIISVALLSYSAFFRYFLISQPFPIFESSLLDTQGIYNFGFILLALFVNAVFFVVFSFTRRKIANAYTLAIAVIVAFIYFNDALADLALFALKNQTLAFLSDNMQTVVLSYIAKSKYYAEFYPYIFLILSIIFCAQALRVRAIYREKIGDFDIEFRQNNALNSSINSHFVINFVIAVISCIVLLYYDLVASKPISIDEPIVITPNEKLMFEFDLAKVSDGKLHRYAYITPSGKKVRFFIINRFKGKITPTVVFDSCMICGDMGYVQRNSELICVACNVRIFLPSVGKRGGCNPIPVEEFSVDLDKNTLSIALEQIEQGETYFSESVVIEVEDPVSKKKIKNDEAKKSDIYKGITYYFESDETYKEFISNPSSYTNKSAPYRIEAY